MYLVTLYNNYWEHYVHIVCRSSVGVFTKYKFSLLWFILNRFKCLLYGKASVFPQQFNNSYVFSRGKYLPNFSSNFCWCLPFCRQWQINMHMRAFSVHLAWRFGKICRLCGESGPVLTPHSDLCFCVHTYVNVPSAVYIFTVPSESVLEVCQIKWAHCSTLAQYRKWRRYCFLSKIIFENLSFCAMSAYKLRIYCENMFSYIRVNLYLPPQRVHMICTVCISKYNMFWFLFIYELEYFNVLQWK